MMWKYIKDITELQKTEELLVQQSLLKTCILHNYTFKVIVMNHIEPRFNSVSEDSCKEQYLIT